jgi:hypothetical protein
VNKDKFECWDIGTLITVVEIDEIDEIRNQESPLCLLNNSTEIRSSPQQLEEKFLKVGVQH